MRGPLRSLAPVLCLTASAALGAAILEHATTGGIGLVPDSVSYLRIAESVAAGDGAGRSAMYPPVYGALLAAIGVRPDDVAAARWLHVLMLAATAILSALLVRQAGGSSAATTAAAALVALAPDVVESHAYLLSEPLAILLGSTGFLLLGRALHEGGRVWLLAAAAAAAAAVLTRYAAVVYGMAGLFTVFTWPAWSAGRRIRAGVLYAFVWGVPLLLWLLRNYLTAGTATNRQFAFHPPRRAALERAAITVAEWIAPPQLPGALRLAGVILLLLAIGAAIYIGWRSGSAVLRQTALFVPLYAGFLLLVVTVLDAHTPIDARLLVPLLVATVVLLSAATDRIAARRGRGAAAAALAYLLIVAGAQTVAWAAQARADGLGFRARIWRNSALMARVRTLPLDAVIYTNAPDAVFALTGRAGSWLPRAYSPHTLSANPTLDDALAEMAQQPGAWVALFRTVHWRPYLVDLDQLHASLSIAETERLPDGVLLRLGGRESRRESP